MVKHYNKVVTVGWHWLLPWCFFLRLEMRGFVFVALSSLTVRSCNDNVELSSLVISLLYWLFLTTAVPLILSRLPSDRYCGDTSQEWKHTHIHTDRVPCQLFRSLFLARGHHLLCFIHTCRGASGPDFCRQTAPAETGGPHSPSFPPPCSVFLSLTVV